MKEKSIFKKRLKILLLILVVILMINLIKYMLEKNDGYIQKIDIPVVQESSMSIIGSSSEKIDIENLDIIVLYDTVWVPINDTFNAIFGDKYVENINQTLKQGTMTLNIDFENNTITIPKYIIYSSQKIDNTIVVEIEEYENKKYIPLYLVSNINNITVKLDNKEIYKSDNYISSIDVIKEKNDNHVIEIYMTTQNENKNETYIGQSLGSLWREEALKRIEKYRKNNFNIVVKNQNDRIYENIDTKITMTNNEFRLGTAIEFSKNENNYKNVTRNIFNITGSENNFKWWKIEQNGYTKANDIYIKNENKNMYTKGHCLWWDYRFSQILEEEIIGIENNNGLNMISIYSKYNEGLITIDEAKNQIELLKQKFENIVLNHIDEEVKMFPNIYEWDVINEVLDKQYFKYYLYDENFLIDNSFLNNNKKGFFPYTDNEDYYKFLAKCFDKVREINNNAKLILNENKLNGNVSSINDIVRIYNNIKKYTKNIDAVGFQQHTGNKYYYSPQSFYNSINTTLDQTDIKEVIVAEYDNYTTSKLGNYSNEEKKIKADYLRDSIIMAYSNPNISEFTFWVYNSNRFEDEERAAYEELVTPWLNYKEMGVGDSNGYSTRLYNGEYTGEVTLPNGKKQTFNFKVGNNLSNSVEIVVWTKLTGIDIDTLPNNLNVYRSENLNLSGGYINAYFDDNTVEKIAMNDPKVLITGYDKNYVGKQTITATVEGYSISFDVNVLENISNIVTIIKQDNNVIKNIDSSIYSNTNVDNKYQAFIKLLDNMVVNSKNVNLTTVEKAFDAQFNILNTIIEEYNAGRITISNFTLNQLFFAYINVIDDYKLLYSYYVLTDELEFSDVVQKSLNGLIDKYNDNLDIESIIFLKDIITVEKDIYNNKLQLDSKSDNYLNKQGILKIVNSLSNIIDNKIELFKKEEKSKLKIVSDTDMSITTNKDVTITLLHGDNTTIINNDGKDTYTFTENGKFIFKVSIKNEIYALLVTVDNIDKSKVDVGKTSEYMLDGNYIINIEKNTKVKTLVQNLIINSEHTLLRNGSEVSDKEKNVATGDVLKVGNRPYTLVVTGDINSDGDCDLKDLIILRKYLLGETELTNVQIKASDIVKDGNIDLKDLLQFRKEILK